MMIPGAISVPLTSRTMGRGFLLTCMLISLTSCLYERDDGIQAPVPKSDVMNLTTDLIIFKAEYAAIADHLANRHTIYQEKPEYIAKRTEIAHKMFRDYFLLSRWTSLTQLGQD